MFSDHNVIKLLINNKTPTILEIYIHKCIRREMETARRETKILEMFVSLIIRSKGNREGS